jgi:hypothetical protein
VPPDRPSPSEASREPDQTSDRAGLGPSNEPKDLGTFELGTSQKVPSPEDRLWQRDAERARREGLASVQRTSERWGATLLAVTGLLTTVTALQGPRDLSLLRDLGWKILGGGLAAAAVLVAAIAVLCAALAAQGKAVDIIASGPELKRVSLAQTKTASRYLKSSRVIAIFVVPLYLAALGVATYAPRSTPPSSIYVQLREGPQVCANSVSFSGTNAVLTVANQQLIVPVHGVTSVSPSTCNSQPSSPPPSAPVR